VKMDYSERKMTKYSSDSELGAPACGMKAGHARRTTRGRATVNAQDESGARAEIGQSRPLARSVTDWLIQVMDQWVHESASRLPCGL
jgi:hypothetical protein